MAQIIVEIGRAPAGSRFGAAPVMEAAGARSEEITSSGTSQATSITANVGDTATVVNNGTEDVWFAVSETAAVGTTFFVPADKEKSVGGLGEGDTISVINDS